MRNFFGQRKNVLIIVLAFCLLSIFFGVFNVFVIQPKLSLRVTDDLSSDSIQVVVKDLEGKKILQSVVQSNELTTLRLPVKAASVSAKSKDGLRETIAYIPLMNFSTSTLALHLTAQKQVESLGIESLGCDLVRDRVLYSYGCSRPSAIVRHTSPPDKFVSPSSVVNSIQQGVATPYRAGLIGDFSVEDQHVFKYLDVQSGVLQEIRLPGAVEPVNATIVTNNNPGSSVFMVADIGAKRAYLYSDVSDISPKSISLPLTNNESHAPLLSLLDGYLFVYDGQPATSTDETKQAAKNKDSNLVLIDTNAGTENSYKLSAGLKTDKLTALSAHTAVFEDSHGFRVFDFSTKEAKLVFSLPLTGIGSSGVVGGSFYYTNGGAVYSYNSAEGSVRRVFSSGHVVISQLFIGSSVSFSGFVTGDPTKTLHSYLLSDIPSTTNRLEDILPLTPSDASILRMDYTSSTIKVQLQLDSTTSDRATGNVTYEQSEFDDKKSEVLRILREKGLNLDAFTIYFTP